jgi:nitrogen fixation/metabolism regulation signal transduction histidine kinase
MVFNSFRYKIIIRVIILTALLTLSILNFQNQFNPVSAVLSIGLILTSLIELVYFLENTNRKLTRFLESVKYSDFTSGFAHDSNLGKSFAQLNRAFNEVLDAFRQTRKEKEESFQYLNTVVQHVNTGLFSFDAEGKIGMINNTAKRFLRTPQIHNIIDVKKQHEKLYDEIISMHPGDRRLIEVDLTSEYAITCTQIKLRGRTYNLIAIQNIKSELEQNEIQAWQNLSRVLRHEIMNSITPIASLTATLNDILAEDLIKENEHYKLDDESLDDIKEGLRTIENRSRGLIKFVDAYRDYTSLPSPKPALIELKEMLQHVVFLVKPDMNETEIDVEVEFPKSKMEVVVDRDMIEMVLINILKNAREALESTENPNIKITVYDYDPERFFVVISDNGPGIIPEAIEKIFIPFFTTKDKGSGIGLALSRQIMQLHGGSLAVESIPEKETRFILSFKRNVVLI